MEEIPKGGEGLKSGAVKQVLIIILILPVSFFLINKNSFFING
jgi:hypothetical protein